MMLLIGYGNPARGDDGLGPQFVERIAAEGIPGVRCLIEYQLNVEHALLVSQADLVVFADATREQDTAFTFTQVTPVPGQDLASHSLSPGAVVSLAQILYGRLTEAYVMAISGYMFDQLRERLSDAAMHNLELAFDYFRDWAITSPPRPELLRRSAMTLSR
jgi:hydrogenase maturation protease